MRRISCGPVARQGGGQRGGGLEFGLFQKAGRAGSGTIVVRMRVEGTRVLGGRRWSGRGGGGGGQGGGGGGGGRRGGRRGFSVRPRRTPWRTRGGTAGAETECVRKEKHSVRSGFVLLASLLASPFFSAARLAHATILSHACTL